MLVENVFGVVRVAGQSDNKQMQLNGELNLDLLMASGFPVSSVRGLFAFDGRRLWLGSDEHRLTGQFCGGRLDAYGLIQFGDRVEYIVHANLIDAELERIVQVVEPTAQRATGKLDCRNIRVWGTGTTWEAAQATGTVQLHDANIYGAPMIVRLLRELRIRETAPDAGMFSRVEVDFHMLGWQMSLNPVILEGETIFLQGDGVVLLNSREIDLTMKTRLGNRRMQIPVISDIIGGVGDQLVQLKITGPMSDPVVTRVVMPMAHEALMQIQSEEDIPSPPTQRNRLAPSNMFRWNPF